MDLEQHAGSELPPLELLVDVDHRQFDHVRRRPLDGRVDGVTLRTAPHRIVRGADVADIPPAAGDRLYKTVVASEGDSFIHVTGDARELFEVLVDDTGGFLAGDAQALREAEGRDAVGNAVVHHLGFSAHFRRHQVDEHSINLGGGGGVHV